MACHVRLVPVTVRSYNGELRVHASRIVGYRCVCSCGARTGVKRDVRGARAEIRDHVPSGATGGA